MHPFFSHKKAFFHLLFWLGYLCYEGLVIGHIQEDYYAHFYWAIINIPIMVIATYFTIYYCIKRFFLKKKYWQFILLLIGSMLFFATLRRWVNFFFVYPKFWPEAILDHSWFYWPKIMMELAGVYLFVGLLTSGFFIDAWYTQNQFLQSLEKEKAKSELALLRSQLHPHFIFNTLNNIYALAQNNSPQTSRMIHKLSALLSYMLYDSQQQFIKIDKEINYIKNYIDLEKIRYGNRLDVCLNVLSDLENVFIPPLLILPLVENCFKHGINNETDASWIRIDFSKKQNIVTVKVENSRKETINNNSYRESGIGLKNLRKRLDIFYFGKHELEIMDEQSQYLVILQIQVD